MTSIGHAIAALEQLWPVHTAEEWDQPGLVVGDPAIELSSILLSVDLTEAVVHEAIDLGANLIVTHHPLLLRGVHSVSEDNAKGRLLSQMIRAQVASFAAHTNADVASDGVSFAIAKALNLQEVAPLTESGHGRVGLLPEPMALEDLVALLHSTLPETARGIACSGLAKTVVQRVALCGGAGDSFVADARNAGAEVYVTSDLRHHVTQDADIPLVDISHWASESLWLPVAANSISALVSAPIHVSQINTDPWIFRRDSESHN